MRHDFVAHVRHFLVAITLGSVLGCGVPPPAEPAPAEPASVEVDHDAAALLSVQRYERCGAVLCDRVTQFCCNNHCGPIVPGIRCAPDGNEGSAE